MIVRKLDSLPEEVVSHAPQSLLGIPLPICKKVLLRCGDIPHVTNFSIAYFEPGQVASAHSHADMVEVFLVQDGCGVMIVDGFHQALSPGVCVVIEPHEQHEIQNTSKEPLTICYFGIKI